MAVSSLTWLPGSGIGKIGPLALLGPGPVGPIGPFGPGTRSAHWPNWARVPLAHLGPGPAGPIRARDPLGPIGTIGPIHIFQFFRQGRIPDLATRFPWEVKPDAAIYIYIYIYIYIELHELCSS